MAATQRARELVSLKAQVDKVIEEKVKAASLSGVAKAKKLAELKEIIDQVRDKRAKLATVQAVVQPAPSAVAVQAVVQPVQKPTTKPIAPTISSQQAPQQFDQQITTLQQKVASTSDESQLNNLLGEAKQLLQRVTTEYIRLANELDKQLPSDVPQLKNTYATAGSQNQNIFEKMKKDIDTPSSLKNKLNLMGVKGGSLFDELFAF
jgi:hypothetical protein